MQKKTKLTLFIGPLSLAQKVSPRQRYLGLCSVPSLSSELSKVTYQKVGVMNSILRCKGKGEEGSAVIITLSSCIHLGWRSEPPNPARMQSLKLGKLLDKARFF